MRKKISQVLFTVVAIIQTILHYLGVLGIISGVIALIFKNTERGIELLIGGVFFIVIKYIIGFVFHLVVKPKEKIIRETD